MGEAFETNTGQAPTVSLPDPADVAGAKLVVLDLDGTLLDADKHPPAGVWEVLEALVARGIVVAPASGRQYATLHAMFARMGAGTVYIAENGALVMHDGVALSTTAIEARDSREAVERALAATAGRSDAGVVLCGTRSAYVQQFDPAFLGAVEPYYLALERVPDLLAADGPLANDTIIKIATCDLAGIERTALPALAPLRGRLQVVQSGAHWADVMSTSVNKGVAVRALQDDLGVTADETIAFGDYLNDLEMLRSARFGIAMQNAHPEVLAVAGYVAPPNTDRGVLRALDAMFGLGLGLAPVTPQT